MTAWCRDHKIAAYAKESAVTQADVDAVADPVLSAEVFKLSDGDRPGLRQGRSRSWGTF